MLCICFLVLGLVNDNRGIFILNLFEYLLQIFCLEIKMGFYQNCYD